MSRLVVPTKDARIFLLENTTLTTDQIDKVLGYDRLVSLELVETVYKVTTKLNRKSTGLCDSEGREIFEGDWVMFNVTFFDGNFRDEPITGKIVYVPEKMSFQLVNVKSDYWREYTGGDDSTYQPFSELNFDGADFKIIDPPELERNT